MKLLASTLALSFAAACESKPTSNESSFFNPESLEEGTVEVGDDFSSVPCAGQGSIALRGQVLAPAGRLARSTPRGLSDWLVPSAHAAPLEGEMVVANVEVTLFDRTQPDTVWATTTTDAIGRYCVYLPDEVQPSVDVMIRARTGPTQLRRVVTHREATTVSLSSEALAQILEAHALSRDAAINLETLSDTAIDILDPVTLEAESTATSVERVKSVMLNNDRVKKLLETE